MTWRLPLIPRLVGLCLTLSASVLPIPAHARLIIEAPFDTAFPRDSAFVGSVMIRLDETLPPTPGGGNFTIAVDGVQFSFTNAPVGCGLFPGDSTRCYLSSPNRTPMVITMNPPVSAFGITGFIFGEGELTAAIAGSQGAESGGSASGGLPPPCDRVLGVPVCFFAAADIGGISAVTLGADSHWT